MLQQAPNTQHEARSTACCWIYLANEMSRVVPLLTNSTLLLPTFQSSLYIDVGLLRRTSSYFRDLTLIVTRVTQTSIRHLWQVRRTRTLTTTPTTVPRISCPPVRLRSQRSFTWRALRSREGRFKFGRVGTSRSRRHSILLKNGDAVWRSSHGFLFWPGVYWRFLRHLPHLSAFFLPRVTPWPRSGVVCHAIILRNACIYMRSGLKTGSGPLTRRSTTWISLTRLYFFLDL